MDVSCSLYSISPVIGFVFSNNTSEGNTGVISGKPFFIRSTRYLNTPNGAITITPEFVDNEVFTLIMRKTTGNLWTFSYRRDGGDEIIVLSDYEIDPIYIHISHSEDECIMVSKEQQFL